MPVDEKEQEHEKEHRHEDTANHVASYRAFRGGGDGVAAGVFDLQTADVGPVDRAENCTGDALRKFGMTGGFDAGHTNHRGSPILGNDDVVFDHALDTAQRRSNRLEKEFLQPERIAEELFWQCLPGQPRRRQQFFIAAKSLADGVDG